MKLCEKYENDPMRRARRASSLVLIALFTTIACLAGGLAFAAESDDEEAPLVVAVAGTVSEEDTSGTAAEGGVSDTVAEGGVSGQVIEAEDGERQVGAVSVENQPLAGSAPTADPDAIEQPSSPTLMEGQEDGLSEGQSFTDERAIQYLILAMPSDGKPGRVRVIDGTLFAEGSLTLGTVEKSGLLFEVTAIGQAAFAGNANLKHIVIEDASTDVVFYGQAFKDCRFLESVAFPTHIAGIGTECFSGCESLKTLQYPSGATSSAGISENAFVGCLSLETLVIPALMGGSRRADYFNSFEDYNERAPSTNEEGYDNFWGGNGTVHFQNPGPLGSFQINHSRTIVRDCPQLKTIVFMAGNPTGAFAFCDRVNSSNTNGNNPGYFDNVPNLTSIVYETTQPWYYNPNGMGDNSRYYGEALAQLDGIDLYYAVDYYATEQDAIADDHYGSSRLARVEYKRGTPVSAIASGDAQALSAWAYGDAGAYGQLDADGAVPDPNVVAANLGLSAETTWAWHLTETQSRRDGLTESCKAYLVDANDLQGGRMSGSGIDDLYRICDYVCSQGMVNGERVQDTCFGPDHYYYNTLNFLKRPTDYPEGESFDPWITLGSNRESNIQGALTLLDVNGNVIPWDGVDITYQRYDPEKGGLADTQLNLCEDGPLLMTVTPRENSRYTGELKEWVFVTVHNAAVLERYTDISAETAGEAAYPSGKGGSGGYLNYQKKGAPYSVGISSADAHGALVAAGYAGLVGAPITTSDEENEEYGFAISTAYMPAGRFDAFAGITPQSFNRVQDSLQSYSVEAYKAFERLRGTSAINAPRDAYPWGSEALVVNPTSINDVAAAAAAYAYAKKCPVFYSGEDGLVGDSLLEVLSGFDGVVVMGDESCLSASAYQELEGKLGDGTHLGRVEGDARSASSLALHVANLLIDEGKTSPAAIAISDAADPIDAISSIEFTGYSGGVTLVSSCTADSKTIAEFVREHVDQANTILLFGRDSSHMSSDSFSLYEAIAGFWNGSSDVPGITVGDTLVLSGARYTVGKDNLLDYVDDLWEHADVPSGTYRYSGGEYIIPSSDEGQEPSGDSNNGGEDKAKPVLDPIIWTGGGSAAGDSSGDNTKPANGGEQGISGKTNEKPGNTIAPISGATGISGRVNTGSGSPSANTTTVPTASGNQNAQGTTNSGEWLPAPETGSTTSQNTSSATAGPSTRTTSTLNSTSTRTGAGSNSGNRLVVSSYTDTGEDDAESGNTPGVRTGVITNTQSNSNGNLPTANTTGANTQQHQGSTNAANPTGDQQAESINPNADIRTARTGESDDASSEAGESSNQSGSIPPIAVGVIVALVVAALGAALWFAMRRPKEMDELDEELV